MSKILYVNQCGEISGGGITLLNYSKILGKGNDLIVYCSDDLIDMFNYLKEHGIKVKKYNKKLGMIAY